MQRGAGDLNHSRLGTVRFQNQESSAQFWERKLEQMSRDDWISRREKSVANKNDNDLKESRQVNHRLEVEGETYLNLNQRGLPGNAVIICACSWSDRWSSV